MSQEQPLAPFVTFYSFKGGVGRSMALINTAGILAGRGFHVLVIDLDLEAPGLSYLDPNAPDESSSSDRPKDPPTQPGFVDLLSDAVTRGQEADLFSLSAGELAQRYTRPYKLPPGLGEFSDGSLHIMPAGKFDGGYTHRFDELNLRELYENGLGEPLMRAFKKKFAEAGLYDYVLVDSRTGFSDEAGICTRDLADYLVILSGLNRQNIEGTSEFMRAFRASTKGQDRKIQVILSPVPNGEDALLEQREAVAKTSFEKAWGAEVDLSLQIPYHPQLALTEEPHIFRRRRGYLFDAYRAIERRVLVALGHDVNTLMQRIKVSLQQKDYAGVVGHCGRMIRFDRGRARLTELALGWVTVGAPGAVALDSVVADAQGHRLVDFLVENIPVEEREWGTRVFLRKLESVDVKLADRLYGRMVRYGPEDADLMGNYASFLTDVRKDPDRAEELHKRAIEADPKYANSLCNYAFFLTDVRKDPDRAEELYKQAIEVDPKHANNLGNYARLLFADGRTGAATELVARASELEVGEEPGALDVELLFYSYTHGTPEGRDCALMRLRTLIGKGIRSPGWDLSRNVARAVADGHPEAQWLAMLAAVISDGAGIESLEPWSAWREAGKGCG